MNTTSTTLTPRATHPLPSTSMSTRPHYSWKWTRVLRCLSSARRHRSLWPNTQAPPLRKTNTKLKSYTGTDICVKGTIDVDVTYKEQNANLPLVNIAGSGPSLLGRNWLYRLRLDWSQLYHIKTERQAEIHPSSHRPVPRWTGQGYCCYRQGLH